MPGLKFPLSPGFFVLWGWLVAVKLCDCRLKGQVFVVEDRNC